eukprot:CAMPEP_0114583296 /NCGR_PEP_ID=MMETSP0125-20121206/7064_1 /TAXON_ID=485358 ORGANISM="Aristerostoma sp., Strain ATCC 50986" /NCGR_SAMPLE_ID=MMETSP0125 /ASSEMBLY_ACC=CAM_ASM_000245 /LENGTH=46 /DNA_ID= /DNA_START= /DNA_END= /DNA_ORIENTATION=
MSNLSTADSSLKKDVVDGKDEFDIKLSPKSDNADKDNEGSSPKKSG